MRDWQFRQSGSKRKESDMMKSEIPSRRVVLRGALAVGCSLLIPAALLGCDSKKGENSTGAAPAGSPSTSADSAAPAETGKVTQASVQYQTQPKGEQKCDGCLHFIAESNTCKLVEGQVSPEGWCSLWAKKA
jgi:High potential iron-sulfur protein